MFLCQFVFRAGTYGIYNCFLGSKDDKIKINDEGVYGAFTYSWRSLFMSFDFHSRCHAVFFGFYLENLMMIAGSYVVMYSWVEDVDSILNERFIYHIYAGISAFAALVTIALKFFLYRKWQRQNSKKVSRVAPPWHLLNGNGDEINLVDPVALHV